MKPKLNPGTQFPLTLRFARVLAHAGIFAFAGIAAFLLRFEFDIPSSYLPYLGIALPVWVVTKMVVFRAYRLDRRSWKFFSAADAMQVARANAVGSILSAVAIFYLAPPGFPRAIPIIDLMFCSLLSGAVFMMRRVLSEAHGAKVAAWTDKPSTQGRAVLIYGAGRAGVALLSELRANSALGYRACGFIDDDPALHRMYVNGLPVLGTGTALPEIVTRTGARELLIAIPSASGEKVMQILEHCQQAGVRFRTVAALGEIIEGKGIAAQIRDVDVQDLLSRSPVKLDHVSIRHQLEGKVVMVTGAAGSIGSELCRQIARFHPAAIVAFEVAETPLFHIEREMRADFPEIPFHAEIGNVQNALRVATVLDAYRPSVIYHAAAYKHVPMMEANLFEAIENNVFGTLNVAEAAARCGVEEFVLISTDKAVRPTSVMGATKRLCELLVLSLSRASTRFVAVRFGNVLGSNGSVIPLFKQQIAAGGPVRVTHPEMKRFFMTIPEASQLVLQASSMGRGGEIYVLDMGSQVKILDLARKLIQLSGLVPDVDIKIEFTGTRPGEKLYEELNLDDELTVPTEHRKIKIFSGREMSASDMLGMAKRLRTLCAMQDRDGLMKLMREMVPEYTPSQQVMNVIQQRSADPKITEDRKKTVQSEALPVQAAAVGS